MRAIDLHKRAELKSRGFTLLEVILAMLLATVLLAAVWVAVRLELRFFESGRSEVERAQLARAVLRQMRTDLRSAVVYRADFENKRGDGTFSGSATAGGESGSASSPSSPQAESESSNGNPATDDFASRDGPLVGEHASGEPQDATWAQRGQFYGTPTSLRFDVRDGVNQAVERAARRSQGEVASAPWVNLKTVQYELLDRPQVAQAGQPTRSSASSDVEDGPTTALVRRELPWTERPRESAGGPAKTSPGGTFSGDIGGPADGPNVSTLDQETDAFAPGNVTWMPEISRMSLRYFDGGRWRDSWDSRAEGRWPTAVEIAIRFANPEPEKTAGETTAADSLPEVDPPADASNGERTSWDYRIFVQLQGVPQADHDTLDPHGDSTAAVAP